MIIETIKTIIPKYFTDKNYQYHSLNHTFEVYENCLNIAEKEKVSESNKELLLIAALFHDTGYSSGPTNHEKRSAKIAEEFLTKEGYPPERTEAVKHLILSTEFAIDPDGKLQSIIKDADLAHIGKSTFTENCSLLLAETQFLNPDKDLSDRDWLETNIEFIENHSWNTKGAKKLYNKKKKSNLSKLKSELKDLQRKTANDKPEKGVETMYRVALRNHNQLSKIADNKANILLSITAIMLSLIISSLVTKLDSNPELLLPTMIIIVVNLVTMFFSILATRPKVSSAPYSREKFMDKKVNILFFGNFYKLPLAEFEWGMNELRVNRELLYSSLTKDLYFLGAVLAKKYRFLQIAYSVFMGGLVVAVVAFIWAVVKAS